MDNWYRILQQAATEAKRIDPSHRVSTAHGEIPTASEIMRAPAVDVWGVNIYRNDNPSAVIQRGRALRESPTIPDHIQFYISETGVEAGLHKIDELINTNLKDTINSMNPQLVGNVASQSVTAGDGIGLLINYVRDGGTPQLTLSGTDAVYNESIVFSFTPYRVHKLGIGIH